MCVCRLSWYLALMAGAAAMAALSLAGCGPATPAAGTGNVSPSGRPAAGKTRAAAPALYPVAVPGRAELRRHLLVTAWTPVPGRPWSHRLVLAGTFTAVASAGEVLYLLETLPRRAEPMQLLVRVDLRTGTVRYARRLVPVSGAPIVVSRSGVWLLGSAWLSRNLEQRGPLVLYRFDPQRLRLISQRTVWPVGCCEQATLTGWYSGRLWLSVGSVIRLIQPTPWTVLQTIRISAGQVESLSFSPDRRRVYLALIGDEQRGGLVQERVLPGWRLVHRRTASSLDVGPVSVAAAGLWLIVGAGMTGQIQLLSADLSHVRLVLGAGEAARGPEERHFFPFASPGATVLAGATWLTASNALACLQPDTGRILAEQPGDQTRGPIITKAPVAVGGGDIYGLGADGLVQVHPPAAC